VAIKPVNAVSSAVEGGLAAGNAIDGKPNTRWGSIAEDGAWITFDFGAKAPVGYMKLTWENAYGKEYALRVPRTTARPGPSCATSQRRQGRHRGILQPERINARYIRCRAWRARPSTATRCSKSNSRPRAATTPSPPTRHLGA
jgi:hypothetical protein